MLPRDSRAVIGRVRYGICVFNSPTTIVFSRGKDVGGILAHPNKEVRGKPLNPQGLLT